MRATIAAVSPSRRPLLFRLRRPTLAVAIATFVVAIEIAWIIFLGYCVAWLF